MGTFGDGVMRDENSHREGSHAALIPGLIVAGLGVLFLLNNLHIFPIYNVWRFWPVILIAIGATKLIDSPHTNEKTGGAVMVVVGSLFLASNLGALPWSVWEFWPLILIGAGVMMLLNRTQLLSSTGFRSGSRPPGLRADAVAIFGGFKRRVTGEDYHGAKYVAVFGGGEIDL